MGPAAPECRGRGGAVRLLVCLYDVWSSGRIHAVTLGASALLVVVFEGQFVVADTMAWQAVTAWVRSAGS